LGRIHYKFGNYPASARCYQQALTEELPADWRSNIYISLAFVYKRTGLWDKASEVWHNLAEGDFSCQPVIYEELAKYYEHRIREYQRALFWVEKAMSLLSSSCTVEEESILPFSSSGAGKHASWQYRKARLQRKLERLQAKHKVES
jgi:tetratricopeptide (TPR) repeat protein